MLNCPDACVKHKRDVIRVHQPEKKGITLFGGSLLVIVNQLTETVTDKDVPLLKNIVYRH